MRSAERFDLAELDITNLDLPVRGERIIHDAKARGLALRLRASGARTWILMHTRAGKTARQTLGDVKLIPLRSARLMAAVETGSQGIPVEDASSAPLFDPDARISDVMPRYLASGANGRWKASTLRNMKVAADMHILPLMGKQKVRNVTPEDVARWHRDVTARTTGVRMALSTLSGLMLYAEDHGLRTTGSNPCRGLRKKQTAHRGNLLPTATIGRLWAALDRLEGRMPDACDAVRLLLLTGARRSEILALAWDRIVGPRAVLEDSKTGPRTIWLNAPARAVLERRLRSASGPFVFPAPKLKGPIKVIDRAWRAILKEAGIGPLRVHDLRHHFASVAVSNGIDLRLIGQLLGHQDIDSTLGYAHLATSALMKSASRVSALIDRSLRATNFRIGGTRGRHRKGAKPHSTAPSATEARRG